MGSSAGMALDSGGFREVKLVSTYRSDEYGISCVAFDPQEDLLWAATYGASSIPINAQAVLNNNTHSIRMCRHSKCRMDLTSCSARLCMTLFE